MTDKQKQQLQFAEYILYANLNFDDGHENFNDFVRLVNESYLNQGLYNEYIELLFNRWIEMYNQYCNYTKQRDILMDLLNKLKSEVSEVI